MGHPIERIQGVQKSNFRCLNMKKKL